MQMNREITCRANNPKIGMRLDELASFVQSAMRDGATGHETVEVTTVGLVRPRVKTAKVAIKTAGHTDTTAAP
jgi:hypothetical protein